MSGLECGECVFPGGGVALRGLRMGRWGWIAFCLPAFEEALVEGFLPGFGDDFGDGGDEGSAGVQFGFGDWLAWFGGWSGQVERGDLGGVEEQAGAFGVEIA